MMELSERHIKQLTEEGFVPVWEESEGAGTIHDTHAHDFATSILVVEGSITAVVDGIEHICGVGERVDIPSGAKHRIVIGEGGSKYVIGQKKP